MRLSEYLREGLILYDLDASGRPEALKAISSFLQAGGFVPSADDVYKALWGREEAHTTALGYGVAIPHAVIPALQDRLLLVASAKPPLDYEAADDEPVDLLFVLLSPPEREGEHIKLLARICRLARHPGFLDQLRAARDARGLYQAILDEDSKHV